MMHDERVLGEAAQQGGQSAEAARQLVATLRARLQHESFYVYRTGGTSGGAGEQNQRRRTLLAFPSGDAALAFAQRNRLGTTPQLLRLSLPRVLTVLLAHASIEAVLFANDIRDDLVPGRLPEGLRFERTALLAALEHSDDL